jgi:hypothetical protein
MVPYGKIKKAEPSGLISFLDFSGDFMDQSQLIIYQTEDGQVKIDVRLENENVWLTQMAMAKLFETTKQNISLHINNILNDGELSEDSVVKESFTTAADGKKYKVLFYSLDMIVAVGYRVKSKRGTQFRILSYPMR